MKSSVGEPPEEKKALGCVDEAANRPLKMDGGALRRRIYRVGLGISSFRTLVNTNEGNPEEKADLPAGSHNSWRIAWADKAPDTKLRPPGGNFEHCSSAL
jgi:hypothetical protein